MGYKIGKLYQRYHISNREQKLGLGKAISVCIFWNVYYFFKGAIFLYVCYISYICVLIKSKIGTFITTSVGKWQYFNMHGMEVISYLFEGGKKETTKVQK